MNELNMKKKNNRIDLNQNFGVEKLGFEFLWTNKKIATRIIHEYQCSYINLIRILIGKNLCAIKNFQDKLNE